MMNMKMGVTILYSFKLFTYCLYCKQVHLQYAVEVSEYSSMHHLAWLLNWNDLDVYSL